MKKFIVIAGPQAAGKSTVISNINDQYQSFSPMFAALGKPDLPFLFPLQESRQMIVHRDVVLGGIFMTGEQETDVVQYDLRRMNIILSQPHDNLVYLDECNIFTLAHARAHGFKGVDVFFDEYIKLLEKLQAAVIFLDVSPDISWERRKSRYEQRLVCFPREQHLQIMKEYFEYLQKLYPKLLEVYDSLLLPKIMIDAKMPKQNVVQAVNKALANFFS